MQQSWQQSQESVVDLGDWAVVLKRCGVCENLRKDGT
jgi:hypothetical protein